MSGGTATAYAANDIVQGLSPHERGNLRIDDIGFLPAGSIPA